ncbi:MAG: SIS domain-containing protein [Promethearchaeota archaeon]
MTTNKLLERFQATMHEIVNQVEKNIDLTNIDDILSTIKLIIEIFKTNNKVFVYGAGRSGFVGRCLAQRLMHLGIKSCFISDAVTYQYTDRDLLIVISGSGETVSSVAIAKKAKSIGGNIVLLSSTSDNSIAKLADRVIIVHGKSKDVAVSQKTLAPYTSLFDISALAVLDSIGGVLMQELGVTEEDIEKRHASIE